MTTDKLSYYRSRRQLEPEVGKVYENAGGGMFMCIDAGGFYNSGISDNATFMNIKSFWALDAHGCGVYEDGRIDWDYSTNGRFVR